MRRTWWRQLLGLVLLSQGANAARGAELLVPYYDVEGTGVAVFDVDTGFRKPDLIASGTQFVPFNAPFSATPRGDLLVAAGDIQRYQGTTGDYAGPLWVRKGARSFEHGVVIGESEILYGVTSAEITALDSRTGQVVAGLPLPRGQAYHPSLALSRDEKFLYVVDIFHSEALQTLEVVGHRIALRSRLVDAGFLLQLSKPGLYCYETAGAVATSGELLVGLRCYDPVSFEPAHFIERFDALSGAHRGTLATVDLGVFSVLPSADGLVCAIVAEADGIFVRHYSVPGGSIENEFALSLGNSTPGNAAIRSALADDTILSLRRGRFAVEVEWQDHQGTHGRAHAAAQQTPDSGLFWFFEKKNWELQVKVLDGCGLNGHYWVLGSASTDVGYTVMVKDLEKGVSWTFTNPRGRLSPAIADTSAFATCG